MPPLPRPWALLYRGAGRGAQRGGRGGEVGGHASPRSWWPRRRAVVLGTGKRYFGAVDVQHLLEDPHTVIQGRLTPALSRPAATGDEAADRPGALSRTASVALVGVINTVGLCRGRRHPPSPCRGRRGQCSGESQPTPMGAERNPASPTATAIAPSSATRLGATGPLAG